MGYLCYIFVALLGGGCGGLIFSLTTGDSHKLPLPFLRKGQRTVDIETGFVGHMFIGAFAGLLLLCLAITQVNFNVEPAVGDAAGPFTSVGPLGKAGMLVVMHTLSITMIGGFLGLRIIVELAEEAYNRLKQKIQNLEGEVNEKEIEAEVFRLALLARTLMNEKYLDAALVEADKSLALKATKFGETTKALILRREGDFSAALATLDRALKLKPDVYVVNDAAILWNKACYLALSAGASALEEITENLDKSLAIKPEFRKDIQKEEDFQPIIDNASFRDHFGLNSKEGVKPTTSQEVPK